MLWLDNLFSYSLQIACLGALGIFLPLVLRLRIPRAVHAYLQAVLAVCLLLPALQPWEHRLAEPAGGVLFGATGAEGDSTGSGSAGFPFSETILLVLAVGCAARLMWLMLGLARLRLYRKRARSLAAVSPGISDLQSRMGVWPCFYASQEVDGPVTFGLRRPVILLPEAFLEMNATLQEAIACHELLHVRRRDWMFALCEELIRAVFWFHPVVLWLLDRIRLTREQIVDGLVIRWTNAKKQYVQALLEMAAAPARTSLAAPSFARKRHLRERIRLLLKESPMTRSRLIVSAAAVCAATALAGGVAVRSFPLETASQESQAKAKEQEEVFKVGSGVSAPSLIYKVEPQYTEEARDAKVEGKVALAVEITAEGKTDKIRVLESLDRGLDQKAIEAVKQWRFRPGRRDGKPVRVRATIEVNFRLF